MSNPILKISDLAVSFQRTEQRQRRVIDVVSGVDLELHAGETVALVGESGSGKTLTALNPLHGIKKQIGESLALHQGFSGRATTTKII